MARTATGKGGWWWSARGLCVITHTSGLITRHMPPGHPGRHPVRHPGGGDVGALASRRCAVPVGRRCGLVWAATAVWLALTLQCNRYGIRPTLPWLRCRWTAVVVCEMARVLLRPCPFRSDLPDSPPPFRSPPVRDTARVLLGGCALLGGGELSWACRRQPCGSSRCLSWPKALGRLPLLPCLS